MILRITINFKMLLIEKPENPNLSKRTIFELMPSARQAHESLPDKIRRWGGILG